MKKVLVGEESEKSKFSEITISDKINNFNLIRIVCAFLVFYEHAFPIFTGKLASVDISRNLFAYSSGSLGVAVFFCISGYLVSKSYYSSKNIIHFIFKRIFRIFPALLVLTILTIVGLSLVSTYNFKLYFFNNLTYLYLQNSLVFRTYYYLPGVFETNIYGNSVNGSLWSIPYEFFCYLLLPLILTLNFKSLKYIHFGTSIILIIVYQYSMNDLSGFVLPIFGITLQSLFLPFLFFNCGVLYFVFEDRIKFNRYGLAFSSLILILVLFEFLPRTVNIITISYLTFYLSKIRGKFLEKVLKIPDISYGFYLYAFPIQQTISYYFYGAWTFELLFFISLIICLFFAYLSWKIIEYPFIKLKISLT